jgi:hypothetical protein
VEQAALPGQVTRGQEAPPVGTGDYVGVAVFGAVGDPVAGPRARRVLIGCERLVRKHEIGHSCNTSQPRAAATAEQHWAMIRGVGGLRGAQ